VPLIKNTITFLFRHVLLCLLFFCLTASNEHSLASRSGYRVTHVLLNTGRVYYSPTGSDFAALPLPPADKPEPLALHSNPSESRFVFMTTASQGIFRFDHEKNIWEDVSSPLFKTRSIYSRPQKYRKISAFAMDRSDPRHLVCATKHEIYESFDRGSSWQRLSRAGLGDRNYVTALAVLKKTVVAGTSFSGIYLSRGNSFSQLNTGLPGEPYSAALKFYDEVASLDITEKAASLYAGFASGKGIYELKNSASWVQVYRPVEAGMFTAVTAISVNGEKITASIGAGLYSAASSFRKENIRLDFSAIDKEKITGIIAASAETHPSIIFIDYHDTKKTQKPLTDEKKAIYANVQVTRKNLSGLLDSIEACRFNAIVIDMKDDFGSLYFPTENATAHRIGAVKNPLPVKKILARLKSRGIYAIARVVVFKDRELYRGLQNRYAINNSATGLPWKGTKGEFWVDPFSLFVHEYNISLAKELEELGFDEIQFDYIRFPSDGPVHLCRFPAQKLPGTYKSEILADFLYRARREISIPLSTDIYGFNSWYRFGNSIGQDMEEFARFVDFICPMVYPSHFGNRFYMAGKREDRSYRIIHDGGMRARAIAPRAVIRPYLQAFKLFSPTWGTGYILNQYNGARDSGCAGFTYWNASGNYQVLRQAFQQKSREP